MQYSLDLGTPNQLDVIHTRLKAHYGNPAAGVRFSPVGMLIMAMLGSRTRDPVSLRAFQNLRERFGTLQALACAEPEDVYGCIREITYAKTYAIYIPQALQAIIRRFGTLDLELLRGMAVEQALMWLQGLRGVGPKISACVLNFSELQMRALVIDTHYLRFASRFQLVHTDMPSDLAVRAIQRQIPDAWLATDTEQHHVLVRRLAQEFCVAGTPECHRCPLHDICPAERT
jgi:endonuclease-3